MATHSSILAWRIPWTEEPGGPLHGVTKSWIRLNLHAQTSTKWEFLRANWIRQLVEPDRGTKYTVFPGYYSHITAGLGPCRLA